MLHETPGPLEPAALLLPAELLALWLPLLIVALVLAVKLNGKMESALPPLQTKCCLLTKKPTAQRTTGPPR